MEVGPHIAGMLVLIIVLAVFAPADDRDKK